MIRPSAKAEARIKLVQWVGGVALVAAGAAYVHPGAVAVAVGLLIVADCYLS